MESTLTGEVDRTPISFEDRTRYWAESIYNAAAALVDAYARAAQRGINQEVIAERLGKDSSQISRWLSGEKNMTVKSLSEMALAMDSALEFKLVELQSLSLPNYHFTLPPTTDTSSRQTGEIKLSNDNRKSETSTRLETQPMRQIEL